MNRRTDERKRLVEELHTRYGRFIYDKCVRILRDNQEAEDAVQETFINAYRYLDRFTYGESHLPWLYRIATNVSLQFLRKRRRRAEAPLLEEKSLSPSIPLGSGDTATRLDARRFFDLLLASQDERGREIVVAHYIDGMTQGETADMLGISRRAVVKRLTAFRAQAQKLMDKKNDA